MLIKIIQQVDVTKKIKYRYIGLWRSSGSRGSFPAPTVASSPGSDDGVRPEETSPGRPATVIVGPAKGRIEKGSAENGVGRPP